MGVVQNSKVRRFAFELKMQDKSTFLLAADGEGEMEEWISTLNKILHSSFEQAMQEKRNGDIHDADEEHGKPDISSGSFQDSFQTARDIESKMKSEARLKLFTLDPDTQKLDISGIEPDIRQFEEKFGKECWSVAMTLRSTCKAVWLRMKKGRRLMWSHSMWCYPYLMSRTVEKSQRIST
ncbi:hypothetical protein WMY93_022605 [Mugilogobius chulae]|uniref:PH domain-containing protein n=1 Tax=Mugilogobius chulae TaxID=88201 RepID=A0AAW0N8Z5_9GOBI